ncbi:MAG: hypothetical protein HQK81_07450 [Desulfovibrionaceae bacterium]|nr:hypothetical protein [Desulfovibrionaceae bacterium]MBF0513885.1 hypothetical protein [Desulfovibrionaceae bacterium]
MPDIIIAFPFMHPELAGLSAWPEALCFDPGLAPATPVEPGRFRPEGLPLAPAAAAGAVGQLIAFGGDFKDPRGLADFAAAWGHAFAPGSPMAIRRELAERLDPEAARAARAVQDSCRAQTLLGLAYVIEENALALKSLDSRIDSSFARFQRELGLAGPDASGDGVDYENCGCEDDEDSGSSGDDEGYENCGCGGDEECGRPGEMPVVLPNAPTVAGAPEGPPWRLVLEALLFFAPPECALLTADPDIASAWDEFGARLAPPAPGELASWFPGRIAAPGLAMGRAPGHALISRTARDAEKPWLDVQRTVFFIAPGDRS